jgi:hypothetical protein
MFKVKRLELREKTENVTQKSLVYRHARSVGVLNDALLEVLEIGKVRYLYKPEDDRKRSHYLLAVSP